jgi:hypothetical protein
MGERLKSTFRLMCAGGISALLCCPAVFARPVVFADSTTVIAEYRENATSELQVFDAPAHNWSIGLGRFEVEADDLNTGHSMTYLRANLLVKRWNLESAQANIFVWGGLGGAHMGKTIIQPGAPPSDGHGHGEPPPPEDSLPLYRPALDDFAWTAGGQVDYETRRIYASYKLDLHESDLFTHRADTLQLGFAPYEHGVDSLATWLVVSGRRYSGDMHQSEELAVLLRFFKKLVWVELGATTDGNIQAMAMVSF